jgi:hypothetical protein
MTLSKTQTAHVTALATSLAATVAGIATTTPTATKIGGALSALLVGLAGLYVKPPTGTVTPSKSSTATKVRKAPKGDKVAKPFVMADGVTITSLPKGLSAYAGYVSGTWRTYGPLVKLFPKLKVGRFLGIATNIGAMARALDIESGDATPDQAGGWVKRAEAVGITRPRLYMEISEVDAVLASLKADGIPRDSVRWWIAHPGTKQHICGPHTCGRITFDADATQYDWAPGYDLSYCRGDFLDD